MFLSKLARYLFSGGGLFLVSMAILYVLYGVVGLPYYIGTLVGAAIAITGHYAATRWWVFPASKQTLIGGYERFVVIALVVVACITSGTVLLVNFGANVYVARALVSLIAAVGSFFLNGRYNFHTL